MIKHGFSALLVLIAKDHVFGAVRLGSRIEGEMLSRKIDQYFASLHHHLKSLSYFEMSMIVAETPKKSTEEKTAPITIVKKTNQNILILLSSVKMVKDVKKSDLVAKKYT